MTPTLYALCGLAFAGKSTLAEELRCGLGAVVVSTDEINARRGLHGGDGLPVEEWATTWGRAVAASTGARATKRSGGVPGAEAGRAGRRGVPPARRSDRDQYTWQAQPAQ